MKSRFGLCIFLLFFFLSAFAHQNAYAKDKGPLADIVIDDRGDPTGNTPTYYFFDMKKLADLAECSDVYADFQDDKKGLNVKGTDAIKTCTNDLKNSGKPGPNCGSGQIKVTDYDVHKLIKDVYKNPGILANCTTMSFDDVKKKDKIRINFITDHATTISVNIREQKRNPQIVDVINAFTGAAGTKQAALFISPIVYVSDYHLENSSSNLTVSLVNGTTPNTLSARDNLSTGSTGFIGHFYLGLDARFSKLTRQAYDKSTQNLQEQDVSGNFYFSANFRYANMDADQDDLTPANFWKYFAIKAMFKLSDRPLDTIGWGITYRPPKTFALGLFNYFSPFVAMMWSKDDTIQNGSPSGHKYGKPGYTWGLSFNIDPATVAGAVGNAAKTVFGLK